MSDSLDIVVIGAGIVGLAVARALAQRGRSVIVLERHAAPIQETSTRNSGVIHSGIYYPPGSLKARLCVDGRHRLYDFLERRDIAHRRFGKLIVAQRGQESGLAAIATRARANGVTDLEDLSAEQVRAREPGLRCETGLWCPSTGIVDVHELAQALIADLEAAGGVIAYRTSLAAAQQTSAGWRLECRCGDETLAIDGRCLVNSAGLEAIDLLRRLDGYPGQNLRTAFFAKGNYFSLGGARPFRHLVYPLPNEAGLGIHATLDLDGSVRFGPNVEWVDQPRYDVDPRQAAEFYDSIREYWPGLRDGALQPGYAGVRPKLVGPGSSAADFVIEGESVHGCAGLVNLLGIESPGLTSSLAIGEQVAALLANA